MEIDGKRLLLTGATGGLGRAIAAALAGHGAELVLSGRQREALEALAAELPGTGHSVVVSDLAEAGAAERLAAEAGPIDGLIANAGLPGSGSLESFSPEQIQRAVRVNLEAPIILARQLLPAFAERGKGHLLFVASLSGKAASPRASIYNATKFGLRGFALALREDLEGSGSGIGVSVVSPGFVRGAGMFAESGAKPPPGIGTTTPERVGTAVVDAITRNRGEIVVAPLQQRFLAGIAQAMPALAGRVQRGPGTKVAESLARGQANKR